MVRHIVMWSLEGNLTKQEKKETAGKIKELLEPIKREGSRCRKGGSDHQ